MGIPVPAQVLMDSRPVTPAMRTWMERVSRVVAPSSGTFVMADDYGGADIGAKINAALGEHNSVYVKATGTISTAVGISAGQQVVFGPGTWTISVTGSTAITLNGLGASVVGQGQATILSNTTTNRTTIATTTGFNRYYIGHLVLTRTVTAIAGGYGIAFGVTTGGANGIIEYVYSEKSYHGFLCGPTSYSFINNCMAAYNVSHGFMFGGTASTNGMQWYIRDNLSQQNGGAGFRVQSVSGPSTMSVGDITSCRTYANSGAGLDFIAAGGLYAIQSLRIRDCFLGNDGGHEISLDTYGTNHHLANNYIELGGTGLTGPTLADAISGVSDGVHITANNGNVSITGGNIMYQATCGINAAQTGALPIVGVTIIDCGAVNAGGASAQSGIYLNATGDARIVGTVSKKLATTTQLYGVYCNTDGNTIVGCELAGQTAAIGGTVTNTTQIGNSPLVGTGWGAPTGTLARTTFDESTVTLPELGKRVAALVADLTAQRIIGP